MNKIIFCGEDIVASRNAFSVYVKDCMEKEYEVVKTSGKEFDKNFLVQNLDSNSLFGNKRVLVIENYFSGQKSKEKEDLIEYLNKLKEGELVFWESKEFSKTDQLKLSSFTFKSFKLSQTVFSFLENLSPENKSQNIINFNQALINSDVNFIFQMLIRQIRILITSKDTEMLAKLPPWQQGKLKNQSSKFSEVKLYSMYKKLLDIDFQQKTSSSPFDLKCNLDLFVLEI